METYAALDDIIRDDARAVGIVKNVRAMFQRNVERASGGRSTGTKLEWARKAWERMA